MGIVQSLMQNCFKFKSEKPKESSGYTQVRTNPIALDEVGEDSDWDGFDNWDSEDGRQKAPTGSSNRDNKPSAISITVNDPSIHTSASHPKISQSSNNSSSAATLNNSNAGNPNAMYTSYTTPVPAITVPLSTPLPTHTITTNIGSNVGSAVEQPILEESKPEIDVFKDLGMSPTYEAPRTKKVASRPTPQPSVPVPTVNYPVAPSVTSRVFALDNLMAQEPKGVTANKGGWGGDEDLDLDLGLDVAPDNNDDDDDSGKKKGLRKAPKQPREKKTAKKKGVGVQVIDDV